MQYQNSSLEPKETSSKPSQLFPENVCGLLSCRMEPTFMPAGPDRPLGLDFLENISKVVDEVAVHISNLIWAYKLFRDSNCHKDVKIKAIFCRTLRAASGLSPPTKAPLNIFWVSYSGSIARYPYARNIFTYTNPISRTMGKRDLNTACQKFHSNSYRDSPSLYKATWAGQMRPLGPIIVVLFKLT